MRVTDERLKARAEQLRKQGIRVRPVLNSIAGHNQKLHESTDDAHSKNDAEDKTALQRSRLAS